MYCATCGKELPDGTSVCDECGTVLSPDIQIPSSGEETNSEEGNSEPEHPVPAIGTESGHRPYMDYKPFSSIYTDGVSDQAQTNGQTSSDQPFYRQNPYEQIPFWKQPYRQEEHIEPGRTGFAIASLVMGIMALCSCCLPIIVVPLGLLAVIFAVLGIKSINRGIAIAGLILGIIALVLGTMMLILLLLSRGSGFYHFW